ncbi:MAG: signal recognition particle protein [Coriobacteriia bacterium]|nr:signal recognition particle protein [Coriobacteriia bacterium]
MFENLSDRLQAVFSKLTGRGALSEADVDAAMREVRMALLEADVNFKTVKEFVARVRVRAVGADVMKSLTPGQMVVKIVLEELTALMGGSESRLVLSSRTPAVIMLVGLQGSGKTTAAAKLANLLRKQGKSPLLVACDVYRPAAIDQLEALGRQLEIPVYRGEGLDAVAIAREGIKDAIARMRDVVIVDTAGRLHVDEDMMAEAAAIRQAVRPDQVLMVIDAMTGQDAVNAAAAFAERVDFDGVIVTKLDGDARGGAALSVRAVTGKPIKFAGVGEKLDALEPFHPERMAKRILGMGDVVSLIEKAQDTIDADAASDLEARLASGVFTLDDFLSQLQQVRKMGSLSDIISMIPGANRLPKDAEIDEGALARTEAIIRSMTPAERAKPSRINGSRRERIANGAGVRVFDVNQVLKQFTQAQKMMKQLGAIPGGGKKRRFRGMPRMSGPF